MTSIKYIFWQDEGMWLGYLEDYPDYWTQGVSKKELEEPLFDIYKELTSEIFLPSGMNSFRI